MPAAILFLFLYQEKEAAQHRPPVHLRSHTACGVRAEVQACETSPHRRTPRGTAGRRGGAGEAADPPSEAEGRLRPQADGRGKARTRAPCGLPEPQETPHTPQGCFSNLNCAAYRPPPTRGAPRNRGASPPAAVLNGRAGAPRRSTRNQHRKAARATRRHILPRRTRTHRGDAGGLKRGAGTRAQDGRPPPVGGEPRRCAPVADASEQDGRPPPVGGEPRRCASDGTAAGRTASAYKCMHLHTSAYECIRAYASAYERMRVGASGCERIRADASRCERMRARQAAGRILDIGTEFRQRAYEGCALRVDEIRYLSQHTRQAIPQRRNGGFVRVAPNLPRSGLGGAGCAFSRCVQKNGHLFR